MTDAAPATRRVDRTPTNEATLADTASAPQLSTRMAPSEAEKDKVLPLPGWLVKFYFIFPIVLYVPDAIFNFYVYSDGVTPKGGNPVVAGLFFALWGFVAFGVVGMAYLLSVLAPWHWAQGHHLQAFFCGLGVLVATAVTIWCSLAFRSGTFQSFPSDEWAYSIWPQLRQSHFSVTMLIVAVVPGFWVLFWAVVQPTTHRKSLREIQESHEERLLRMQQEAELKQVKAAANAKVRAAQLAAMTQTAIAARKQAAQFISQGKSDSDDRAEIPGIEVTEEEPGAPAGSARLAGHGQTVEIGSAGDDSGGHMSNVLQLPQLNSLQHGRDMSIMNRAGRAQPALMSDSDVEGSLGIPASDAITMGQRRPPMLGGSLTPAINPLELADNDGMTGTTGPRPALRRSAQPSTLVSAMNGPNPAHVQVVTETLQELNIPVNKRTLTAKEQRLLIPRVAEKLDCDDTFARAVVGRVMKSEAHRNS
jgi:hypothetical protein